jgi:protein TonB
MNITSPFNRAIQGFSAMQIALAVSFVVHAVPLTIRFVDPESFDRVFQDTPLEVILVNAATNEKPDKAQAIAQSSMAGGGDSENGRATTFLPASELTLSLIHI